MIKDGRKYCPACKTRVPVSGFHASPDRKDRLQSTCAECRKIRRRKHAEKESARRARRREEERAALGTEQTCVKCGVTKLLADFTRHATSRTGLSKKCRECISLDARKEFPLTKDPKYRTASALRKYGLTVAQYDAMLQAQGGVCAVCRQPETRIVRGRLAALCVDHDHVTGRVRGLTCARCNMVLGHVGDSAVILMAMIGYLQQAA